MTLKLQMQERKKKGFLHIRRAPAGNIEGVRPVRPNYLKEKDTVLYIQCLISKSEL